jgi:hypothetical protein
MGNLDRGHQMAVVNDLESTLQDQWRVRQRFTSGFAGMFHPLHRPFSSVGPPSLPLANSSIGG